MTATILGLVASLKTITLPKGKAQGKLLEDLVENKIVAEGFIRSDIVLTKAEKEAFKRHERIDRLNAGEYLSQPMGNNDRPDFIVYDGVLQRGVEAKSAVGETPMFNSGFPSEFTIYVIGTATQLERQVRVIDGSQIVPKELKKLLVEATADGKARDAFWNAKIEALGPDLNPFGMRVYSRVQGAHAGGKSVTSYFTPRVETMEAKLVLDLTDASSYALTMMNDRISLQK